MGSCHGATEPHACESHAPPCMRECSDVTSEEPPVRLVHHAPVIFKVASKYVASSQLEELTRESGAIPDVSHIGEKLASAQTPRRRKVKVIPSATSASEMKATSAGRDNFESFADTSTLSGLYDSFESSADRSTIFASFETSRTDPPSDNESSAGSDMPEYGNPAFWRDVYSGASKHTVPGEWLLSYSHFKALRWHRYLRGGNILEIGCGNSNFMADAHADGFRDITCTDIDQNVINTMRERSGVADNSLQYLQCDACNMHNFADGSFKIIFDKSTMDALLCAERGCRQRCSAEVHRVLADDGMYVCVSFGDPETMKPTILDTGDPSRRWRIQVLTGKSEVTEEDDIAQDRYMYACSKEQISLASSPRAQRRGSITR